MKLFESREERKRHTDVLERIAVALEKIAAIKHEEPKPPVELRKTSFDMIGKVDLTGESRTMKRLRQFGE